jgi:deazaflavin-dependent oxidoreductase (nitroreductase family)
VIEGPPSGAVRALLRAPLWLYRVRLGFLFGHRLAYIAHRGRRTGKRREVVAEVVQHDPARPEIVVVAAWGRAPDWYLNLRAGPALEVRVAGRRWVRPVHRFLDGPETLHVLLAYQRRHPRSWRFLAPRLGFPAEPGDPAWPGVARTVHAIAFRPASPG